MKAIVTLSLAAALSPRRVRHWHTTRSRPEHDDQKPLKITGTLTKVDRMNPHIWALRGRKEPRRHRHHVGDLGGAPDS
jgi:hypothetical protein